MFWPFHCLSLHEGGVSRRSFFGNFQYQTASTVGIQRTHAVCWSSLVNGSTSTTLPTDRIAKEKEKEEGSLFKANTVNEEGSECDRATLV